MDTPFYFGPDDAPLFGRWHPACLTARRGVVVVLCPPIGFEYNSVYRGFRSLAIQLAGAGFDVVRFDYPGTGDSAGSPTDPAQADGWLAGVAVAVEAALKISGCAAVALVGARFGATLAALAAADLPQVESLVLWSPFRSGKTFAREVRALDALSGANDPVPGPDLSAAGYIVTAGTVADLAQFDLLAVERIPAARVLVIERDDLDSDRKLVERLGAMGPHLTLERTGGTAAAFIEGAQISRPPVEIVSRITEWLAGAHPVRKAPSGPGPNRPARATVASGCRERPFVVGETAPLFGIVSEPDLPGRPEEAVIFLNTGAGYHIGPHRMFVPLARWCAWSGLLAYRFDIQGLGDSATPESGGENVAYPDHAVSDVCRAVEAIRRETGVKRVLLVGLCSGGWHSVRAVRAGLAVEGVLAINPPLYYGRDEGTTEVLGYQAVARYRRALGERSNLLRLVRGRVNLLKVARVLAAEAARRMGSRIRALLPGANRDPTAEDILWLARAGFPTLVVYSKADPGLFHFDLHLPVSVRRRRGSLDWVVVEDADHTFRQPAAKSRLHNLVLDFISAWRTEPASRRDPVEGRAGLRAAEVRT